MKNLVSGDETNVEVAPMLKVVNIYVESVYYSQQVCSRHEVGNDIKHSLHSLQCCSIELIVV